MKYAASLRVLTALFIVLLSSSGCSHQAWFEGFKAGAQFQCMQYRDNDEVQTCLRQVDALRYEQYREEYERSRRQ